MLNGAVKSPTLVAMATELANQHVRSRGGLFLYFSELLGRTVVDRDGHAIGRLWDLSIRLGEPYPLVQQVFIRPRGQSQILLIASGQQVRFWTETPVRLSAPLSELRPGRREDETQILLREELLDKQVVDVSGAKVERVNDLSLIVVREGEMILAHIDVGLRGLVRRLGWEKALDTAVRTIHPRARYLKFEQLIGWKYVLPTLADPAGLRLAFSGREVGRIHPADLAEILEDLPADARGPIFDALEVATAARVLSEVDDPKIQQDLLTQESDPEKAADLLETMPPDAAADVLAELPEEEAKDLIARMQPDDARMVTSLMRHGEDTAGGLMTTEMITFPGSITVAEAFQRLRQAAHDVEFLYQFYVVDDHKKLLGSINMRRLFSARDTQRLEEIMAPWAIAVHPDDPPSTVAETIEKYNLPAVAVIDAEGILLGMITVDDVLTEVLPLAWQKKLRL